MIFLAFVLGVIVGAVGLLIFGGYLLTRGLDRQPWQEKYWDDEEEK